ncbi:MAG: tRNA epoxyqueuosine(34) reductase QueG [Acidobacteria bacterium]|nr:tRNA epoxyqueuosine(34) reductase QueG [Acidobacteriota bacterium]MBV9478256.1 tRNA epoxyqueuosine(34) reductase QueG [Acidobacteriota bacterium]
MTPTRLSEVWPDLERVARAEGVLRLGASGIDDEHAALFAEWLARGGHASMHYLAKNADVRERPRERYPWARSVVSILVPYAGERPAAPPGALSHHIARYALGDDYHEVLDRILRKFEAALDGVKTWRYVDTGPLSDRAYAAQAGLGWIGKNGMLIDEQHGSYVFIGTLLTALEHDVEAATVADRCGACTRCLDACPTNAILPDRTLDSAHCISYATIEHRGALDAFVAERLEGNAFGCDVCQEACPWNHAPADAHPAFAPREAYRATPVTDLFRFAQADFSALFAKSAIKRAKLAGMQRNIESL